MTATDSAPAPAFDTITAQLAASGREVRDAHEAYLTALARRDELVVTASDQGMPQRAIARALGVTQSRVGRLCLPRSDRSAD